MTDYQLACAISTIICSYRKGELSKPLDHNHVLKWVGQFDEEDRSVILEETLHILTRQYYSREAIEDSVDGILCKIREQVGSFEDIIFANPQEQGSSQKILYTIISEKLGAEFRGQCAEFTESSKIYVYIDDGLYTGGRARTDLAMLIELLPPNSRLYVFYLFAYSNACSYRENQITTLARNKKIEIRFDWGRMLYNERSCKAKSIDFVWPTILARKDEEVLAYETKLKETQKANYLYYNSYAYQKEKGMFSSFEAEERVGHAFLKYGIKICNQLNKSTFRPLGLTTPPSFGFGSLVATDYNISNTAPLVMWWGSLEESDNSPVGCWYPLLPRRDNKKLYSYVAEEESAVSIYSCTPILKTVYRLAVEEYQNEHERSRERTGEHRVVDLMSLDLKSLVEERKQSELLSYLLSLNFENLKVVQTVMYIGRDYETMIQTEYDDEYDGEYDEEDFGRNTISFPVPNPDFVLYEWLRDLEECKGWKSKRIEAEQVYQKRLSLHVYLERAFRILGIECQ